jgi:hypothetical protein
LESAVPSTDKFYAKTYQAPPRHTAGGWGSHPMHDSEVARIGMTMASHWSMPSENLAATVDLCPNCGQPVSGLANGKSYQIDVKETGGKSHKGDIPPCPVPGMFGSLPMVYTADPCGCRVSTLWASTFQLEQNSRADGHPPKPVQIPEATRLRDLKQMEANLGRLYSVQTTSDPDSPTRKAADFWVVVVADQIQRLCPGKHNTRPSPKPLNQIVTDWAKANGLTVPGVEEQPPGVGVPLYSQPNGTMGKTPSHPGQQPSGYVSDNPMVQAADKLALKMGLLDADVLSKNAFYNEMMGEFGYPADYPLPKKKKNDQADALSFAMAAITPAADTPEWQKKVDKAAKKIAGLEAAAIALATAYNGDPTGQIPMGSLTVGTLPAPAAAPTPAAGPTPVAGPAPAPAEVPGSEPVVDRGVRRRRTIRKIED